MGEEWRSEEPKEEDWQDKATKMAGMMRKVDGEDGNEEEEPKAQIRRMESKIKDNNVKMTVPSSGAQHPYLTIPMSAALTQQLRHFALLPPCSIVLRTHPQSPRPFSCPLPRHALPG